MKLGEHDISYLPRLAIKEQALADFLVETTFIEKNPKSSEPTPIRTEKEPTTKEEPKGCWQVYVDRASGEIGRGAGILLVGPEKQEITYSPRNPKVVIRIYPSL